MTVNDVLRSLQYNSRRGRLDKILSMVVTQFNRRHYSVFSNILHRFGDFGDFQ